MGKDYNENLKKIEEFALNIDCLDELTPFTNKLNIFKILKSERAEIKHSNILAWLFDVDESHNIKDKFISSFINEVIKSNKNDKDININDWVLLNYSNQKVIREWKGDLNKNKRDSLDILIEINNKNNKVLIAIENKVGAKEGENQTTKYRDMIENNTKYKEYKKLYVFLTPYGEDASDIEYWLNLTYSEIKTIIKNIIDTCKIDEKVLLLLKDYVEVLEDISMENGKLEEICTKIYKRYKEELKIIFDYKIDDVAEMANYLKETLQELSKEDNSNIIYDDKFDSGVTYVRFATKHLDDLFGKANNTDNCWNNNQRYLFEFHPRELNSRENLDIFFTITLDNNKDDKDAFDRGNKIYLNGGKKKDKSKAPKRTANLWRETIIGDAFDFLNNINDESKNELINKIENYVKSIECKIDEIMKKS